MILVKKDIKKIILIKKDLKTIILHQKLIQNSFFISFRVFLTLPAAWANSHRPEFTCIKVKMILVKNDLKKWIMNQNSVSLCVYNVYTYIHTHIYIIQIMSAILHVNMQYACCCIITSRVGTLREKLCNKRYFQPNHWNLSKLTHVKAGILTRR